MINGIDEFLKNYTMIEIDDLVHREAYPSAESNDTSSGRSASNVFYSMVEQTVGQDLFKKLRRLRDTAVEFHREVTEYRKGSDAYEVSMATNKAEEARLAAEIARLEKDLSDIQAKVMAAMSSKDKIGDLSRDYDSTLAYLNDAKKDLHFLKTGKGPEEASSDRADDAYERLDAGNNLAKRDELLKKAKAAVEKLKADKDKIIQGLVDATLLIDDAQHEAAVRQCGEAMFNLVVMEMEGLMRGVNLADTLVTYGKKDPNYNKPTPNSVNMEVVSIQKLEDMSKIICDSSYLLFTDPRYSAFVNGAIGMRANKDTITEHTLFEMGKAAGAPVHGKKRLFGFGPKMEVDMHDGEYGRVFRDMVLLTDAEKYASNEAQEINISVTTAKQAGTKRAETISTLVSPIVHEQEHAQAKKVNPSRAGIKKAGSKNATVAAAAASVVAANAGNVPTVNAEEKMVAPVVAPEDAHTEHKVPRITKTDSGEMVVDFENEGM